MMSLEAKYREILSNGSYNNQTLEGDPLMCDTTQEFHVGVSVIALVFGLTIMMGNLLVLIVLFKYPAKKFVPLNWLLCHLALADFIMGVTVFWWYGVAEIRQIPVTSHAKPISYGVGIAAIIASLAGLMMISLDRYLLLFYNVKYWKIISRRRLVGVLVLMWLIPIILLVVIPAAGWSCVHECDCRIHNIAPDEVYCFHERCSQMFPPLTKLQMLITSVYFLILFLITIVLYAVMFYRVWDKLKGLRHIRSSGTSHKSESSSTHGHNKSGATNSSGGADRSNMDMSTTQDKNDESTDGKLAAASTDKPTVTADDDDDFTDNEAPHRPGWRQSRHGNGTLAEEKEIDCPPVFISSSKDITPIEYVRTPKQPVVATKHKTATLGRAQSSEQLPPQVKKDAMKRGRSGRRSSKGMKTRRREIELMKSMFIVIAIFVLTSLPSILFLFYTYFNNDRRIKEIGNILLQITTINSLLNPILYFWRIKSMRKNLFKLLKVEKWKLNKKAIIAKLGPQVKPPPVKKAVTVVGISPIVESVVVEQNNGTVTNL